MQGHGIEAEACFMWCSFNLYFSGEERIFMIGCGMYVGKMIFILGVIVCAFMDEIFLFSMCLVLI